MLTWQALLVGLSSESHSLKPAPARPSAKYHVLNTGPGCMFGGGVPVGVIVGETVGLGEPPPTEGVGVGPVPAGSSASCLAYNDDTQTLLLASTARPSPGPPPDCSAKKLIAPFEGL